MEFLWKLLGFIDNKKLAEACQPRDTFSYTIRHKYPKRLVTYDGEQLGERRRIRSSDLSQSQQRVCRKKEQIKHVISKCWQPINPLDELTKERVAKLEKCGRALHKLAVEQLGSEQQESGSSCSNWDGLKPLQKFSFFWQALTGHKLRSTPYANFRQIFSRRYLKRRPQACERRLRVLARRSWLCLSSRDRVPFNLQALLYHVATGQLDPFDDCALRVLLNRWR